MQSAKMSKGLPVVVVEYHHHALPHMYRMIGRKKLPFSGNLLIHLDSHPDLVMPPALDPALLNDAQHVYDATSIESWILPAVLAGHVSRVVWVRPPWSDQIPDGTHRFLVGTRSGRAKVSCAESYFLSECMWSPEEELQDPHELSLTVQTLEEESVQGTWIKSFVGRSYVLDVDLDFYSTQDPFALMFTAEQDKMLQELYHMEMPLDRSQGTLERVQHRREVQLNALKSSLLKMIDGKEENTNEIESLSEELTEKDRALLQRLGESLREWTSSRKIFAEGKAKTLLTEPKFFPIPCYVQHSCSTNHTRRHRQHPFLSSATEYLVAVSQDIPHDFSAPLNTYAKIHLQNVSKQMLNLSFNSPPVGVPLTAELVHDAGCSRDRDSSLPHHPSSRKEMNSLLRSTERFLQRLPAPPTLVTVSRSAQDDYCPAEDVQYLQDSLLEMLQRLYGQLTVTLDYEQDVQTTQDSSSQPLCGPQLDAVAMDSSAAVASVT
ncbi:UPF0489 protein C5orf22 homolog [Ornithodoros turicata]|uniref:UPF0489 protein C5orf22 homolog n=1 Tax=Ornithodoros turicata TaxID=34597 RepID=UPI0031390EF4